MSKQPAKPRAAEASLRPRLVLGWSLFFAFVLIGIGAAVWTGRAVPVLLDVMVP